MDPFLEQDIEDNNIVLIDDLKRVHTYVILKDQINEGKIIKVKTGKGQIRYYEVTPYAVLKSIKRKK